MLSRVDVKNYRSCLHTSLDLHPDLTVLIGPNGSGKTNLLQAIMLLNTMAHEDPVSARRRGSSLKGISSRVLAHFSEDRTEATLTASVELSPDELNRDLLSNSRQKWRLKSRNGWKYSADFPLGVSATSNYGYYQYLRYMRSRSSKEISEPPKWAMNIMKNVGHFCERIKYYGASQFTNPASCPTSFSIEADGRRLGSAGFPGHKGLLRRMYVASKRGVETGYPEFLEIVGKRGLCLIDDLQFEEVQTSSVDYTVKIGGKVTEKTRRRILVIPRFEIGRQQLSPNQLSEGTFKTLALLFHVITDTSSLLLIEEPEVCVHHGLLSSILEIIKSYSARKQIVISTHSDYVLDHVKPENVVRVTRDRTKGTASRRLTDALSAREYSALRDYLATSGNLGEYWREGGLGDRP
jgi:ABC-type lipoprotein export system ATPase subunit